MRDGPTAPQPHTARCPIAIAKGFYWGNTAPIPIQTGMAQQPRCPIAIAKGFYWEGTAPIPIQAPGASRGTAGQPPPNPSIPNRAGPTARSPIQPAAPSLSRRAFIGQARPLFQYKPLAPAGGLRVNHHPPIHSKPGWPNSPLPHRYREGLLLGKHGPYSIPNRDGPIARCPIAIAKGFYGHARPLFQYKPLAPAGGLRVNHHPPSHSKPGWPNSPLPHRYREGLVWENTNGARGFQAAGRRRRRSTVRPAMATPAPRRASVAGSGTATMFTKLRYTCSPEKFEPATVSS